MTIMVFGVFDGLHEGHRYVLHQAQKHGDRLLVVVARDAVVRQLKNKTPKSDEHARQEAIRQLLPSATVVLGDAEPGEYRVIAEHRPDLICLGHDQQALGEDLRRAMEQGTIPDIHLTYIPCHTSS